MNNKQNTSCTANRTCYECGSSPDKRPVQDNPCYNCNGYKCLELHGGEWANNNKINGQTFCADCHSLHGTDILFILTLFPDNESGFSPSFRKHLFKEEQKLVHVDGTIKSLTKEDYYRLLASFINMEDMMLIKCSYCDGHFILEDICHTCKKCFGHCLCHHA